MLSFLLFVLNDTYKTDDVSYEFKVILKNAVYYI